MSEFRVLVTARSFGRENNEAVDLLLKAGCEVVRGPHNRPHTAGELTVLVVEADALIAGNDQVDAAVIAAAPRLKAISRYGVGYDNVDLAAAAARGIPVTNTPGTNDDSVADLVFGLLLSLSRQIPAVSALVRQGRWERLPGTEVSGKTMGIIGFGRIGRGVAKRAGGFSMQILAADPFVDPETVTRYGAILVSREEVLRKSDFITLHVPFSKENRNLIGPGELALMKPTALLINTARGGLVDEAALAEALRSGRLAGAALDVLEFEPPRSRELLEMENALVTPHIGGFTGEATAAMSLLAAQNVVAALSGHEPPHTVNPEAFEAAAWQEWAKSRRGRMQ